MTITSKIYFVATYFEYNLLTEIQDIPCYKTLKEIKEHLKANTCRIQCNLGGGTNRYLSPVLSVIEYSKIFAVTFDQPTHQGVLLIPTTANL